MKPRCTEWKRVSKPSGASVHERSCGKKEAWVFFVEPGRYNYGIRGGGRKTAGTLRAAKAGATRMIRR